MLVASAPGRCGIIGNPSDIYGGAVLSCSIPQRAKCRLVVGGEDRLPEDPRLWLAAIRRFPLETGTHVEWSTDVPRSSGLAGSTALLAATLACVMKAVGQEPDLKSPQGLAAFSELLRDIERNEANVTCGYQDAYMVVHGGLQFMDFCGKHPTQPGPVGKLTPLDAELPFLLVGTGVERLSASVHGPIIQAWLSGHERVIHAMDEITALAHIGKDALLKGDYQTLALAMARNHAWIAELGGSGEPIDHLIALCKKHGALAAKLAGAGLGGTVIALTEDPNTLQERLRQEGYSRFAKPSPTIGIHYENEEAVG